MIKRVSIREANTINAFANPESDTFGNQARSYEKFYKCRGVTAQQAASRLFARSRVCQEIDRIRNSVLEIQAQTALKREITGQYADNATVETFERAVKSGDITNQVACCRILQQRCGQLSDRLVLDMPDSRRLDAAHQAQNKRIAEFMIMHGLLTAPAQSLLPASLPAVDGVLVEQTGQAEADNDIPPVAVDNDDSDNNYGQNNKTSNDKDLQE